MNRLRATRDTTDDMMELGGLPLLRRGQHLNPEQGACFMEYASLLAGLGFSDHPRCTHPLLAHVARLVNDALTDENRQRIAPLVPDVISVRTPTTPLTTAMVIQLTGLALQYEPNDKRLERLRRRAVRRSAAAGFQRRFVTLTEPVYRSGAATQAASLSLCTIARSGELALCRALEETIAAARHIVQRSDPTAATPTTEVSSTSV
jgi:hypothetical protein